MTQVIAEIIALILASLSALVLVRLFVYLKAKINQQEFWAKTEIDDKVLDALHKAVSNVAEKEAKALKEKVADGELSEDDKEYLKQIAIDEAQALLGDTVDLAKTYAPEVLNILIRYLVDRLAKK
jgi:Na+-translocating ferredoxin:NAD+ oxidoreductase RnfG subunit